MLPPRLANAVGAHRRAERELEALGALQVVHEQRLQRRQLRCARRGVGRTGQHPRRHFRREYRPAARSPVLRVVDIERNGLARGREHHLRIGMRQRFERFAAQFNMEQALNIQDLIYEDPDRADVAQWLGAHGWRAEGVHSLDEMRRLGRYVEIEHDDTRAFSTFVTAEKS